jgi:hypothetical protein
LFYQAPIDHAFHRSALGSFQEHVATFNMHIDPTTFYLGASGFASFEVWIAYKSQDPQKRYWRARFWIIRVLMSGVAGQVASIAVPLLTTPADHLQLYAFGIGFCTPALPNLMSRVLKEMISMVEHSDGRATSLLDIDVPKVFNPAPENMRSENSTTLPASENKSSEKHEDQPVSHN